MRWPFRRRPAPGPAAVDARATVTSVDRPAGVHSGRRPWQTLPPLAPVIAKPRITVGTPEVTMTRSLLHRPATPPRDARPAGRVTGLADVLPALDNVVGVTTVEMAEKRGDFIRAVIRARRKAVIFMREHPDEAAEIVAKQYNIEPAVARSSIRNLTTSMTKGVPYWGEGAIHLEGLKRMIEAQRSVGAITGEVDYNKIIDTRFLPDDLKALR